MTDIIPTSAQWESAFEQGGCHIRGIPLGIGQITHAIPQHALIKLRDIKATILGLPNEQTVGEFLKLETRYITDPSIRFNERQLLSKAFQAIREDLTEAG